MDKKVLCYGHRSTQARGSYGDHSWFARPTSPNHSVGPRRHVPARGTRSRRSLRPFSADADSYYACKSAGYSCVIDGYNATTMNNNWAAQFYGADTKGGIGTPPHNCTLYAAWMLAHNGLPNPGHTWGYADQWGRTLAAQTNHTPAVGSIAWYEGGRDGPRGLRRADQLRRTRRSSSCRTTTPGASTATRATVGYRSINRRGTSTCATFQRRDARHQAPALPMRP